MKGFKVTINNKEVIYSSAERVLTVTISAGDSIIPYYIYITGIDSTEHHITWLSKPLEKGDSIKIEVCDISNISPIKESMPSDRDELMAEYLNLRRELEYKGLI